MSKFQNLIAAAALAFSAQAHADIITFNGLAGTNYANNSVVIADTTYFRDNRIATIGGFNFSSPVTTALYGNGSSMMNDAGALAFNGTDYLVAMSPLLITSAVSPLFDITSLDLVGWMGMVDKVTFQGTRWDNSTVSFTYNLGPLQNFDKLSGDDFNHIVLNDFTGLKSLSISGNGVGMLALDNLGINAVPEPGSLAIIGLGLSALAFSRRRKAS